MALPSTLYTIYTDCSDRAGRGSEFLDVTLTSSLSANLHFSYIVGIINQHLYLLNQLRSQRLDINGLAKVFLSVMVARFLHALPAFSGMITADDINRINAVFAKLKSGA